MGDSEPERRVKKLFSSRPHWAEGYREGILRADGHLCHICGEAIEEEYEIDHLIPWTDIRKVALEDPELLFLDDYQLRLARAYLFHDRRNVLAAHGACNQEKADTPDYDKGVSCADDSDITMKAAEDSVRQGRKWVRK